MGKKIMTEFNKGWWNCAISTIEEIVYRDKDVDELIALVLSTKNITEEEFNEVMKRKEGTFTIILNS